MLPIRLGTVDFHLMCDEVPDELDPQQTHRRLSEISKDSIMQAYFAMT